MKYIKHNNNNKLSQNTGNKVRFYMLKGIIKRIELEKNYIN